MITPQEIAKKGAAKYRDVLRAWLTDENVFPIEFPVGQVSSNLVERRQQIDTLRANSKEMLGYGYEIVWLTINQRELGRQTTPRRITVANIDDYLALTRKQAEFSQFTSDVQLIRQRIAALEGWMRQHPLDVIANRGQWDDLLTVCQFFCQHPRPDVYIRELPISVHTKFIETNTRILRDLLDTLLPPEWANADETTFTGRYGLKDKAPLIRLRLLDDQLARRYSLFVEDVSLPVEQCAHLLADHIQPQHVIIVENLINFLTLPRFPQSVGLWGGGFAVHLLKDISWLSQCAVIYWGDIDAHGFEILSDLRSLFPHVRSVMMDQATLEDHAAYALSGQDTTADRYEGLTETERLLAHYVISYNLRLEQEHIPHRYAVARLTEAVSDACSRRKG